MSYLETPPQQIEHRRSDGPDELETICENACETDGQVVLAIRRFPDDEYQFLYNKHDIAIVRGRLVGLGYSTETKIVMDSKCSRLVLIIERNLTSSKEVHAALMAAPTLPNKRWVQP
jgi:hypothetical protein